MTEFERLEQNVSNLESLVQRMRSETDKKTRRYLWTWINSHSDAIYKQSKQILDQ